MDIKHTRKKYEMNFGKLITIDDNDCNNSTSNGYDAIIAISEDGSAKLIKWLEGSDHWQNSHAEFDDLADTVFINTLPGLYYARCSGGFCGCNNPECAKDCYSISWEPAEAIYIVDQQCGAKRQQKEVRTDYYCPPIGLQVSSAIHNAWIELKNKEVQR